MSTIKLQKHTKNLNVIARPPVIAIMGHIDHGKSRLLDYIRKTNIVDDEAGGITQHLSAYEFTHTINSATNDAKKLNITFLDTPGHAAFSAMRSRGVTAADIAVLIVATDDGVKTQTLEAYQTIKESGIPFVVALNKIDLPDSNIEKTKSELAENGIYLEGYGGDVPYVPISAKIGKGVNELIDMLLLVAEMEELSGDKSKLAEGLVIESHVEPKRGMRATLLIKNGTLKNGDTVVAENAISPVRIMEDFLGNAIKQATFSSPVGVVGFNSIPRVGSLFTSYRTKKEAENAIKQHNNLSTDTVEIKTTTDDEESQIKVTIPVIIQTNVAGTAEAIEKEISKLGTDSVNINVIYTGVGSIGENVVRIASGNNKPIIIGFNVKIEPIAQEMSDRGEIQIKTFTIIYKITEWLEDIIKERTPIEHIDEVRGSAKILRTFSKTREKQVIGGEVTEGALKKGAKIRIVRRGNEIGHGIIVELQHQKLSANEVAEDQQFGANILTKTEIVQGDKIEAVVSIVKK